MHRCCGAGQLAGDATVPDGSAVDFRDAGARSDVCGHGRCPGVRGGSAGAVGAVRIAIGVGIASGLTPLIASQLYAVQSGDPLTFTAAMLVLIVVAAGAWLSAGASCTAFRSAHCTTPLVPQAAAPRTARRTAAVASKRVESSVGNGELESFMIKGSSVQPSTTASQPASFICAMTL
jgi:hypothetical protein